jgi:hypothetical protein
MKQLLPLFLFLLPCLAWAQYPSNGNQKITLGEQTTADGLIYRGVASTDTVRKSSIDTMAYMVLDTTTNIMWHYKKATSNAWLRLNLLPSDTASMLTNYWRAGRFSGVLPVANGGTNTTTLTANKVMVGNGTSGVLTPTNLHWDNTNSRLGIGTASPSSLLEIAGVAPMLTMNRTSGSFNTINFKTSGIDYASIISNAGNGEQRYSIGPEDPWGGFHTFYTDTNERMRITSSGNVGIGTSTPQSGYRLHVVDSVYVGGRVSAAGYTTRSDYNLKDEIKNINYGLNEIMQITPVSYTYKSNGEHQLGFIAQDIGVIIPESVHFDELMGVDYQAIIPILTKAIQEQNLLIKALEQRIINLENK